MINLILIKITVLFFLNISIQNEIEIKPNSYSLKDDINQSIIEGFFEGDTTGKKNIYLLN